MLEIAPFLALALLLSLLILAVGMRSWIQWRQTGDFGLRTKSLRPGASSAERLGGLGLLLGLALLFVAALQAFLSQQTMQPWFALQVPLGFALGLLGIGITILAQFQMGASWRIGVDPEEQTQLITHGLYQWVRNPIYSGMFLSGIGFGLLLPQVLTLIAEILIFLSVYVQVRWVEEPYLLATHGEDYADYLKKAGRFFPRLAS